MDYKVIAPRVDGTSLLSQILLNRGFKNLEDITHYLMVDEHDLINPLLLDNMQEGVKLLVKHISLNSNTLIVIDSDCDELKQLSSYNVKPDEDKLSPYME